MIVGEFANYDCPDNNAVVQEEDLKRVNRTSVLLRDRSGYLAGIDMFHELHCLVRKLCSLDAFEGKLPAPNGHACKASRIRSRHPLTVILELHSRGCSSRLL